jgi:hypothetical protein
MTHAVRAFTISCARQAGFFTHFFGFHLKRRPENQTLTLGTHADLDRPGVPR